MPIVTVIIPNYNHASFLDKRISSIIGQTFQDFEIIILDDCSTDNSMEIIERYRNNPKISHIIYNEENSGNTFLQWEKGINMAKGEWIWIAESDDWAEITFLELLFNTLHKTNHKEDVCLMFGQSYLYHNTSGQIETESFTLSELEIIKKEEFIEKKLLPRNYIFNASMAIFKKKAYTEISQNYKNFSYCGDYIFWAEIGRQGSSIQIPQYINYFRKHPKSVSQIAMKNSNGLLQDLKAVEYFRDVLNTKKENIQLGGNKFLKRYFTIMDMIPNESTKIEIEDKFSSILGRNFFIKEKRKRLKKNNRIYNTVDSIRWKIISLLKLI